MSSAGSAAREPLMGRLVSAMEKMSNPKKSSTAKVKTKGGSYEYKYDTLDEVLAVVRPPLLEVGIGLTQPQVYVPERQCYVIQTVLFDAEERVVMDERPMLKFSFAQDAGSWESYMKRYALRSVFGLAGEEESGEIGDIPIPTQPAPPAPAKGPAPRRGKWDRLNELKAQAASLGIGEEPVKAWIHATFGGKPMAEFDDGEIAATERFVEGLVERAGR